MNCGMYWKNFSDQYERDLLAGGEMWRSVTCAKPA